MSLYRSLPIKDRYKVWRLYQDAYPEMSYGDMIKHFDEDVPATIPKKQQGGLVAPRISPIDYIKETVYNQI